MRTHTAIVAAVTLFTVACGGGTNSGDRREFKLQGQIISMSADHREAIIKHEEIPGFMSAMTMPYHVKDTKQYASLAPGDLINAKLVVETRDAYLESVTKVGSAPLEQPVGSAVAGGPSLLPAGAPVPNVTLTDQNGKSISMDSFKGQALVVTFTYTSCPMPTQCPLIDKRFSEVQKGLQADHNQLRAHLLTVTIDPAKDTAATLKAYAAKLGADAALWTFATGDQKTIDEWASRFGVAISRASNNPSDITHNLRTVIIDRQGNLVQTYSGNEWTPEQVLADIKVMVGVD